MTRARKPERIRAFDAALRRAADAGTTLLVASHDHHVLDAADVVVHLEHGMRTG